MGLVGAVGAPPRQGDADRSHHLIAYDSCVDRASADAALRRLVDEYRGRCLWYLKGDYYPETPAEQDRVLTAIARHGDLQAFRRVAELRKWLSLRSSGTSAGF